MRWLDELETTSKYKLPDLSNRTEKYFRWGILLRLMTEELVEGLKKLKLGALLYLVAIVVLLAGMGIVFASLMLMPGGQTMPMDPGSIALMISFVGAILIIVAVIIAIVITAYVMWFIATGHLKRHNSALGIGRTGMIFQIVAVVLLIIEEIISAALTQNPAAIVGAVLGFFDSISIAFLLYLVGEILFGIMVMKLAEEPNVESGFKVTGILYIVAIVLTLIPFIGAVGCILSLVSVILIYIFAGRSLETLTVS
ncbi:MAG: DUF973 family protein [Canidatus Methanoxibalbensis ujae]|nr:DUF973 family protein [Candidatus Methanoxibalbensis ujae]